MPSALQVFMNILKAMLREQFPEAHSNLKPTERSPTTAVT